MKTTSFFLIQFLLVTQFIFAGDKIPTKYSVNLNNVKDDQLEIIVYPSSNLTGEVLFRMPKIIPGTYSIYDFGRFVQNFQIETHGGKEATFESVDVNTWKISAIQNVKKISYWIEDTWDTKIKKDWVFEPAGTNIEQGKNMVMNNHGFFGYFEGTTADEIQLEVIRPENFYGSTGLTYSRLVDRDIYNLPSYHVLVDSPIMYNQPDTTVIKIGNTDVLISVFNDNKSITSDFIAKQIEPILNAQKNYLGGKLPVDKYAFIFYLPTTFTSFGFGALEHNNSSMYFLPSFGGDYLAQMIKDVAAHEFFHIVTPLTIHSEDIHFFDYNRPSMSKHLWLYEGVTEYSAHHVQVKNKLITLDQFLEVIQGKITSSLSMNDTLPFTRMSEGCLDEFKDQYLNVYQKGALIGMCLDLKLLELSDGFMDLPALMRKLSSEFGNQKPFVDDHLFRVIEFTTYPEIGLFLNKYVAGNEPLPLQEYLAYAGIEFSKGGTIESIDLGISFESIGYDEKNDYFYIISDNDLTTTGKSMGLKAGDIIRRINGKELSMKTMMQLLSELYATSKPADNLQIEVSRPEKKGKLKNKLFKGKVGKATMDKGLGLSVMQNLTEKQLKIRNAWVGQ
jgi:predicted metalloprotease with PDZ domain